MELEEIAYEKLTHTKQNCQMTKAFLVVNSFLFNHELVNII